MKPGRAELIVLVLFLGIRKDRIGFIYLLKAVFGLLFAGLLVRMLFDCKFPERLFYLVRGCPFF